MIDENAVQALKEIGKLYKKPEKLPQVPEHAAPIISSNLAKHVKSNSSWSDDMNIMDFANDDNFGSAWVSNSEVKSPWYELNFEKAKPVNMLVITQGRNTKSAYTIQYFASGKWQPLKTEKVDQNSKIQIFRFDKLWAEKIKLAIQSPDGPPSIAEVGVYNERR
ncbi:discoidin domain-containing protein [Pedobacter panaciterrae]